MHPSRIAVVIVTYNSADVIEACLRSLMEGARGVHLSAIVVADNASKDGCLDIATGIAPAGRPAQEPRPPVVPLQMGRNAGYAAAINAGLAKLDLDALDAVLVLNPDCRVTPGALATLADTLTRRPRCGIAVPRLLNPDGTLQPSLRRAPSVLRALVEAMIGGGRAGRLGTLGELITDPRHYEHATTVSWATGAAMLISTAALRQIGPWDESFLLYSEETDFQLRAADLGWQVWYEPTAIVEHIGGESSTNPMLSALIAVNRVRLFRRRRGLLAGAAYYAVVVAGEAVRALAGRRTSQAALTALLRPSKRLRALPD